MFDHANTWFEQVNKMLQPYSELQYLFFFQDTCINAYLSLRTQSRLLITLFSLMLLTGIPELSMSQDMRYLRTALQQDQGEEEARNHFLQQIALCEQKGWTVQANWWFHMMAGIK